ncbi:MAG: hypothetical protein AAF329_27535, partial [Cyanobacteria bacterium P01_A01_bin.17]
MGRWVILLVNRFPFVACLLASTAVVDVALAKNTESTAAISSATNRIGNVQDTEQNNLTNSPFYLSAGTMCNGDSIVELSFRNPSKENNQNRRDIPAGTIYRFAGVAPGIDALVTVESLNNGATLGAIDNPNTGSVDALQPSLTPSRRGGDSSVDLNISFV